MSAVYYKEVLVRGRPTLIRCLDILGNTLTISAGWPRVIRIEDEWYEDVTNPAESLVALRALPRIDADIFSFWNPVPDPEPRHPFRFESEELAVLSVRSFDDWWTNRIKSRTRNLIRKAEKQGLVVRETQFDDEFVRGMTAVFNEQEIRQGRRFWHYGKDAATVRQQFSRFIQRETMIGAYVNDEMVGFVMLGEAGRCAHLGQILSKVGGREHNPNNALMAKAVEICARKGLAYLIYGYWGDTSLAEFKRRCGFEPVGVPHYFVPISRSGEFAVRCGLHRSWSNLVPPGMKARLRSWRAIVYEWRNRDPVARG